LHYIEQLEQCYNKYSKYLQDDFSPFDNFISCLLYKSPFFWLITDFYDTFKGFVYLDNFIGNKDINYSAEITTCFDKKAWGVFTKYCAKFFLKKAFDEFNLYKIKAQIYPENFRVKQLLKSAGFKYESTLKSETVREGQIQDIDVYAIYKDYYYNKR
jgi:RimJ/RimL family protein N-acetyltransferase